MISTEINKIINDNFFIVTSKSYQSVKSCFYGYAILKDKLLIRSNPNAKLLDKYTAGLYINIIKDNDGIIIQQDYFCGYGLFVYRNENFWAISNSLFMLVNYLSPGFDLSLNEDYFALYLSSNLCPPTINETIINEILELSQGQYIVISNEGELLIDTFDYNYASVNFFSQECVNLIENWRNKYESLSRFLVDNDNIVLADLSGGFDTRMLLSITLPLIDEGKKLYFNSASDTLHCHTEDYKIACKLSDIYKLNLNQYAQQTGINLNTQESILLSLYSKFFTHDEFYYANGISLTPIYHLGGAGGDVLRCYGNADKDTYIESRTKLRIFDSINFNPRIKNILNRTFNYIENNYDYNISPGRKIHYLSRAKNHSLRSSLNAFLTNQIFILPLIDPILSTIDLTDNCINDERSFLAYIYSKYLPETKDVEFEGNRNISIKAWEDAQKLIQNFPISKKEYSQQYELYLKNIDINSDTTKKICEPVHYLLNLFKTDYIKRFIINNFNHSLYKYAFIYSKTHQFIPERIIIKLYQYYLLHNIIFNDSLFPNIEYDKKFRTGALSEFITLLNTARIDIRSIGDQSNNLELISINDKFAFVEYPAWYNTVSSKGIVIQSHCEELKIKIRFTGKGTAEFKFMAPDFYDINKKRAQLKIDYIHIYIYDSNTNKCVKVIKNLIGLSHDKPFTTSISINDSDIIDLNINYKPYDYDIDEALYFIKNVYPLYIDI